MSKKTIYISIGVVVLIAVSAGLFLWLSSESTTLQTTAIDTPFGTGDGEVVPQNTNNSGLAGAQVPTGQVNAPVTGLQKISVAPIAGATIYMNASTTFVRYMDKATGHIYEFNTSDNSKKRISNTTIPKIAEVVWGNKGTSLFARSTKEGFIQTFFGVIATTTASSTEGRIEGNNLQTNITEFVTSPKKDQTFFLQNNAAGVVGYLADNKGIQTKVLWSFPSTEWVTSWPKDDTIFLNTKASYSSEGHLYALNVKTGGFSPVLGGIKGLTSLVSPDGKYILYSDSNDNKLTLNVFNAATLETKTVPFNSLPEKCTWITSVRFVCGAPSTNLTGQLPDSWYLGSISFSDSFRSEDLVVNNVNSVIDGSFDLKKFANTDIDAMNLKVSPDGSMLIFENKKDFSLWILPLLSLR